MTIENVIRGLGPVASPVDCMRRDIGVTPFYKLSDSL